MKGPGSTDHKRFASAGIVTVNEGWCEGCTPNNCSGSGLTTKPDDSPVVAQAMEIMDEAFAAAEPAPIDMVLHCPACGMQHIDEPQDHPLHPWLNPPHRSHLCHGCGHIWRPADVPTNGVAAVKTRGKNDSPIARKPE